MPATVTGKPYELTADVIEPTQANFISRADFLLFLRKHGEAALRVAQQLGETYHSAIAEMRTIGLSHSAAEKFARFLLDFFANHDEGKGELKLTLTLTHEEIAQMIGASRETVTRLFADFKKKRLLQVKGSTLIIKNKTGLEKSATLCHGRISKKIERNSNETNSRVSFVDGGWCGDSNSQYMPRHTGCP